MAASNPRAPDLDTTELQRHILQNTLDEVAARDQEGPECCVICLEVISEPCEAVPCGHRNFDYLCVAHWLYSSPQCPLCKVAVSKVVHGPADALVSTSFEKPTPAAQARRSSTTTPNQTRPSSSALNRSRDERPCRRPPRRSTGGDQGFRPPPPSLRREVYRNQRYSKHVGSNRLSRYRELTPRLFCEDEHLVSRARMFIRRELQVFEFLREAGDAPSTARETTTTAATHRRRSNNAEFLLEYVVAILKSVDIMGSSGQAEGMLADFLGRENTRLFLHELRAWLRSPYCKLEDWDRAVQYDDPVPGRSRPDEAEARRRSDRYTDNRDRGGHKRGDFYRPVATDYRGQRHGYRHEPYRRRDRATTERRRSRGGT